MYNRILIANRGEIALRIVRACKEMGVESVAVFSEADRDSAHVRYADDAYCIGPSRSADSYLRIENIISAAEVSGAEAIHPGYGFLAENAYFNEVCRSSEFDFIGPSPEAMTQLGDKATARAVAIAANVPVVPGSDGLLADEAHAIESAQTIGYPVLIKATAGGGGKGMRVAPNEQSLRTALQQAQQEAQAAFGNAGVYLEKFIDRPRHVEVQVIADNHGNVCHLFERDCSAQRRHQKLIEESPSPLLSSKTRTAICEAAARLVRNADYQNAGTVEFIVDQDDNFYFIEVNARIQVEHPVTEMVTGIDLIQTQIRVAAGVPLPFQQEDIRLNGVSMECRINAENPDKNFQPCPGHIKQMFIPGGLGIRFDSHAHAGYTVPPFYDSMIGKLIVHKPTREEAIACMIRGLEELRVEGIATTASFQIRVLKDPAFVAGTIDTKWVERELLCS
ncbi:acetyl-CoA carboxylase biotin carboxylase subunit [Aureliella helgolandensis]|uniref:Biotin carboxylase n=1 Tax=Aureliella helgolandensis TaxID=2527968 RepID=A0A518G317_9BACT|nr:acetyl-CoA carboxylase biotin carboxylase subunit [Aureliella helgolandensis]QDV22960.1 Biotin carboxylase [Aureliella helgolandensis]